MNGFCRELRTASFRTNLRSYSNNTSLASAAVHRNRWFLYTRAFSASVDAEPSDTPKHKPKASTPLRRSASASIPIRSNPTPTRSSIKPVITLATAERYLLSRLRSRLPDAQTLHDSWWIPQWGDGGEIFVFSNGSFVCWGLGEGEARRFAREVLAPSEVGRLKDPETEELEFVTDPTEKTRIQGDLIILGRVAPLEYPENAPTVPPVSPALPADTLLARYTFSQALSRSTALSGLEESLEDYLSSVALLPHSLEKTGKPGLSREALIKKLGALMKFRQGLNLNRENFSDTPDLYWTEPELEGFFKSMTAALEVKARTNAVNEKITYATEVQSTLRQLLTESSTHRMELVIIALIAVEVVIVCHTTVILILLHLMHFPVSGSHTGWPRTLANGFWIISC
ncbi:uncharacterized protein F5147DRAFT_687423 [Suillus discolor]|uniref:DUF155 domain-containing protein n=1 Tax=Suillus discolor TaxID=1912936 RepID=A0A9P7FAV9_9AGAM|nr:uncharacterized protein F5147DRAFT_687423 [Suillus discolor]KAG2110833.1 hypothetical protein F5147DRAFT_687423 [Suillus discolor]